MAKSKFAILAKQASDTAAKYEDKKEVESKILNDSIDKEKQTKANENKDSKSDITDKNKKNPKPIEYNTLEELDSVRGLSFKNSLIINKDRKKNANRVYISEENKNKILAISTGFKIGQEDFVNNILDYFFNENADIINKALRNKMKELTKF